MTIFNILKLAKFNNREHNFYYLINSKYIIKIISYINIYDNQHYYNLYILEHCNEKEQIKHIENIASTKSIYHKEKIDINDITYVVKFLMMNFKYETRFLKIKFLNKNDNK